MYRHHGGPETQLNCGIRIQGNAARQFPKKSFRLLFKTIYGSSKLEFPVFAEAADSVERFDTIVLRSNTQNRTGAARWHLPDENGRRTLLDMGTPQSHGTWVHLYVNCLYWGLYNPSERPQASFCSNYFGGSKDEWDVNNGNTAIDGSYAPFEAMLAQVRGEPAGGGGTNVSDPLFFSAPVTLKARSFSSGSGEWSALNEAFFSIDSEPASAENLVISEIHYRPGEPSTSAEIAESTDRDDYEFIELYNIGPKALNLTGVAFNNGISFAFADNTLLPSGARLVLVRDLAAFTARYGPPALGLIGGEYSGRLSNDGEQVTLSKLDVGTLHDLTYNDQVPWPIEADGDGYSLVLISPETSPNHALPANWIAGSTLGGTPGGAD